MRELICSFTGGHPSEIKSQKTKSAKLTNTAKICYRNKN